MCVYVKLMWKWRNLVAHIHIKPLKCSINENTEHTTFTLSLITCVCCSAVIWVRWYGCYCVRYDFRFHFNDNDTHCWLCCSYHMNARGKIINVCYHCVQYGTHNTHAEHKSNYEKRIKRACRQIHLGPSVSAC